MEAKTVDRPLLQRRTSLKSFWGLYGVLGAIGVLIWVVGFYSHRVPVSRATVVLVGLVPLLIGLLYSWLVRLSTEYRLFQESLEVQSGIISRQIENIQLFRVRDLGLAQSILNRLAGVGDIIVTSTDQSAPHYRLRGVEDPREVYDRLRELVANSQATRRTMIVEQER
ncbi:MAG: hypothetical protein DMD97_21905 [Candidatus Rokuibacteriota bacterium]|nr:MAG: hypothetical protein DMD97_21905 [Candidatus Rokubacteria bacterium]